MKTPNLTVRQKMMIDVKNNMLIRSILMLCGYFRSAAGVGLIAAIFCGASIISCTTIAPEFSNAEIASIDRLLLLMRNRLDLAQDVAKNKWNTKSPIEDLPREKVIVDGLAVQALQHGLAGPQVERFFQAQIDGSKVIQASLFAKWGAAGQKNFSGMPDLTKDIRPVLDKMTPEMLVLLKEVLPVLTRTGADRLVAQHARSLTSDVPGFERAWKIAVEPVAEAGDGRP